MLADSQLLQLLGQHAFSPDGHPMCIYCYPAYPLRMHLQAPFRNAILTPQMEAFNMAMSDVRLSVEWLFGDIVNYFKFLDFKTNLKIGLSSVGRPLAPLLRLTGSSVAWDRFSPWPSGSRLQHPLRPHACMRLLHRRPRMHRRTRLAPCSSYRQRRGSSAMAR